MSRMLSRFSLFAALVASPVLAQTTAPAMPPMPGMTTQAMPQAMPASANHVEMMRQMDAMNRSMMDAPMTGNPDRDFVAMMTPHHQGAIDMARIYLRDGKDPAIRRMAQKIIADQEREIGEFKAWQARHPAPQAR